MEVYKILCRYYILHIASFGSLPCFLLFSFCATWRRNRMPLYHLNFEGEGVGGGVGVWVIWFVQEFFFPKPLEIEFFPDMQRCNIFSSVIRHERYFFSVQEYFSPGISLQKIFFPSKSVCIIFFSEITHNPSPLKSQMVGPLQKMNCLNMALKTMSFSIFKKSIIIHKQKTKEINVECVFLSDKDRTKLYVHFFRPK